MPYVTYRQACLPVWRGVTVPLVPVTERRITQLERVEAMRARLLDATADLLAERGFTATSTNDVVRRAGVSRGALAHHFPTKADLMAAASEHIVAQIGRAHA